MKVCAGYLNEGCLKNKKARENAMFSLAFLVITQHYRFFEIAFKKSVYDSKKT